jgi:hypothetical protein
MLRRKQNMALALASLCAGCAYGAGDGYSYPGQTYGYAPGYSAGGYAPPYYQPGPSLGLGSGFSAEGTIGITSITNRAKRASTNTTSMVRRTNTSIIGAVRNAIEGLHCEPPLAVETPMAVKSQNRSRRPLAATPTSINARIRNAAERLAACATKPMPAGPTKMPA